MKARLYFLYPLLVLLLAATNLVAQQQPVLTFSHSIAVSSPRVVSQDPNGNLYLLDAKRNLLRLDSLGHPLDTYSPPTLGRAASIEAWNPMKVLLFYQDRQELLLLDRFLRPIASTKLSALEYDGMVRAATSSSDDGFWLFNESDLTLSKLDMQRGVKTVETPLELILDRERFEVTFMREYQNMVYLLDSNGGIYVFDNLGNYKQKLPITGLSYIGFTANQLYYVKDNRLYFYDLYQQQEQALDLPKGKNYKTALVSKGHLYLFADQQLDIYRIGL